ncbi:MAG: MoaD/ThiS family protein [Candidatus Rokubacteria bacterium]|nr:MoaD/ThiS family protein [Candidatus Rokubacteria bacterium]
MTVSVTFLGALRRLAGHREARVALDADATVADLVDTLARTYGRAFSDAVFRAPGELQTSLRVFLDEREAAPTERVVSAGHVALLVIQGFEGGAT